MSDFEKYCLLTAEHTYAIDKKNDRTAVTLPIRVMETLIDLAKREGDKK